MVTVTKITKFENNGILYTLYKEHDNMLYYEYKSENFGYMVFSCKNNIANIFNCFQNEIIILEVVILNQCYKVGRNCSLIKYNKTTDKFDIYD